MASTRHIKSKINATQKISQITKAMNMVSASKLRKAERTIKEYRPFIKSVQNTIATILSSNIDVSHKMLEERKVKKTGYLIITTDRGLAGGYNANIYRKFFNDVKLKHKSSDEYFVGVLGSRGFSYLLNKDLKLINKNVINIRDDVQFIDILDLIQKMIDMYIIEEIDEIIVYYNKYMNTLNQQVTFEKILPVSNINGEKSKILYELEPSPQAVLDTLMPIYFQNVIYGFILNAKASEHAARMNAMNNATNNAKEIINKLTVHYNRARQAAITQEITEIVSGASALK
ncbi:MAG: synthase subunit gamma [Haloplasmataceae bacterium]|jgi:F-type H+-transporting ATPase subunit gamma|nr:synthase subunit gamma [Haloplasmataceae bacterium]